MTAIARVMLIACLTIASVQPPAVAQVLAPVWREFAQKTEVGTELKVRLRGGQRFSAVLLVVGDEALVLQPKTRVPVPPQTVPYDDIVALERRREGDIGAAKAAAIGVASGIGGFLLVLAILAAAFD